MGVAERKLREKEHRRQAIVDAAEELFFRQGLQQTTMDQVAAATELSKGTLYLYFRSKDDLYLAINVRAKRVMRTLLEAALAKQPQASGLEQILALGEAFIAFSRDYADYAQVVQDCQIPEGELLEVNAYAREAHEHGERSLELLVAALAAGQRDGSVSAQLEPFPTALLLWAQLSGLLQLQAAKGAYFAARGIQPEALQQAAFGLIRRLLSP